MCALNLGRLCDCFSQKNTMESDPMITSRPKPQETGSFCFPPLETLTFRIKCSYSREAQANHPWRNQSLNEQRPSDNSPSWAPIWQPEHTCQPCWSVILEAVPASPAKPLQLTLHGANTSHTFPALPKRLIHDQSPYVMGSFVTRQWMAGTRACPDKVYLVLGLQCKDCIDESTGTSVLSWCRSPSLCGSHTKWQQL